MGWWMRRRPRRRRRQAALGRRQGRIEFAGVDFGYRAGVPVLHKMTFVAEPGRVTALVGPSGGGSRPS